MTTIERLLNCCINRSTKVFRNVLFGWTSLIVNIVIASLAPVCRPLGCTPVLAGRRVGTLIRRQFKDISQLCGGIHPTFVPESLEDSTLDAVCRGEGKYAFTELVNKLPQGKDYADPEGR